MKILPVTGCACGLLCMSAAQADHAVLLGGDLRFHGNVVAQPCAIAPGDESLLVDFKEVPTKDLYLQKQTRPVPFSLHLINCSTSVYKSVTVTFSGERSIALPDSLLVRFTGVSGSAGVAIDLQQRNGDPLPLDKPTQAALLKEGSMELAFQAVLRGEPKALEERNLQYGPFVSVASYTLNYQ